MRTTSFSSILVDAIPVVGAIGVFGVIYGATASTVMSPGMTLASSLLMFSGAAQLSMVGLLDAGATSPAILLAVAVLGLRHLPWRPLFFRASSPAARGEPCWHWL